MSRRLLALGSLLILAACQGDRLISPPPADNAVGPVFAISSGNSNFAWRPPIANQSATGRFNPNLSPTVRICQTSPAAGCTDTPNVGVTGGQYHLNWKTPKASALFRVSVLVLGVEVGFVDVNTNKNNVPGYVQVNSGANLPIKFELTTDCPPGSSCIDPGTGGTTTTTTPGGGIAGVTIPAQPGGGPPITVTFSACNPDLSSNGLTVFGSCIHIDSNLLGNLTNEAIVFICDVLTDPDLPSGEERDNIHLNRRHDGNINVLPNAAAPLCPSVGGNASIGGVLRALAQGEWKRAASQFVGLIGPKPLYASVLHLGAGGSTGAFSDFQFGEPGLPGYESAGWSYQINGTVGEGWEEAGLFGDTGQAGFGFFLESDHCSLIQNSTHTAWPAGNGESPSYLYLRRDVTVGASGLLNIAVAIDNDVIVWVDGDLVIHDGEGGFATHEGCATLNSMTGSIFVGAGTHKIAIQARDRGNSTYFDAQISFTPYGGEGGN